MGALHLPKRRYSEASMAFIKGECRSRLFDAPQNGTLGNPVKTRPIPYDPAAFSADTHPGRFFLQPDCPATPVYVLVPGQQSSGQGCPSEQMGPSYISLSTGPTSDQSTPAGQNPGDPSHLSLPPLAVSNVVDPCDGDGSGATSSPPLLQVCSAGHDGGPVPALPGPSGGREHFRGHYNQSIGHLDLNDGDMDFLSGHLADGTASNYGYAFRQFKLFCDSNNVNPFTCTPSAVVTINCHSSAIAKFHAGYNGAPIGGHFLVCRAVKAVFRRRPPFPKYIATFDIEPVLRYVANLEPLATLSLKMLSLKSAFLMSFSTLSRVSSLCRMGPNVQYGRVSIFYYIIFSIYIHFFRIV